MAALEEADHVLLEAWGAHTVLGTGKTQEGQTRPLWGPPLSGCAWVCSASWFVPCD